MAVRQTPAAPVQIRTSLPCGQWEAAHLSVCSWISAAVLHVQPLGAQEQMFPGGCRAWCVVTWGQSSWGTVLRDRTKPCWTWASQGSGLRYDVQSVSSLHLSWAETGLQGGIRLWHGGAAAWGWSWWWWRRLSISVMRKLEWLFYKVCRKNKFKGIESRNLWKKS